MLIDQSAYLDEHQYSAGYSGNQHREQIIQCMEAKYVIEYIRLANCGFGSIEFWHSHWVVWVAFLEEVVFRAEEAYALGRLSVSVRWRCTCSYSSPACLQFLCCAISARKASVCVVLLKHSWVSHYCIFHHVMSRKLSTPHIVISDFSRTFLIRILRFHYCGSRKLSFRHFGHICGLAHVGLFQLYQTFLPCYSGRHGEILQGYNQLVTATYFEVWQLPQPYLLL